MRLGPLAGPNYTFFLLYEVNDNVREIHGGAHFVIIVVPVHNTDKRVKITMFSHVLAVLMRKSFDTSFSGLLQFRDRLEALSLLIHSYSAFCLGNFF